MKIMAKQIATSLVLMFAPCVVQAQTGPDPLYTFDFTESGGNAGNGTLDVDASGHATSGSLDITTGSDAGVYPLIPRGAWGNDRPVWLYL